MSGARAGDLKRLVGSILDGRWRLQRLLSSSDGMALFAADEVGSGRAATLEVIAATAVADALERWRCLDSIEKLSHPDLLPVLDVGATEHGLRYAVMERADGELLSSRLARRGRLPPLESAQIAASLAHVLDAIHAAGGVHGNLQPCRVFVRERPQGVGVQVLLGLRSPRGSDARADVYALGALLYQMLRGSPPHASAPAPLPSDVPIGLRLQVERALAQSPSARHASARAFALSLEPSLRLAPDPAPKPKPSVKPPPPPAPTKPKRLPPPPPRRAPVPPAPSRSMTPLIPIYIEEPPDARDTERPLVLESVVDDPPLPRSRKPLVAAAAVISAALIATVAFVSRSPEPTRAVAAEPAPVVEVLPKADRAPAPPADRPATSAKASPAAPAAPQPIRAREEAIAARPAERTDPPIAEHEPEERFTPSAAFEQPDRDYEFRPVEP